MNRRIVILLFFALTLSACEWVEHVISGEVVASVGKSRLYRTDLDKVLPEGLTPEDSTRLAQQYINTWASEIIFLEVAEKQLSKEELDVTKELEDYRKSLIKYRYEQRYINDRLDTLVTAEQIESYYNEHPDKFTLEVPLVRADYLCISPDSPSLSEFRKNIVSDDVTQMQISDSLAYSSAIKYENYGGRWIEVTVLARDFGLDYAEMLTCRKGDWIEYSGDTGLLSLAYIREWTPAGKVAPVEYASAQIRDIILSTRKRALVSSLEQDLLDEALASGKLKVYQDER